ncbi:SAM-dependent methyltransferase [Nocardioides campestrisoli]|uniref:SAM-dependent methyltransferase n=1 Tax=Nocardioides campestrisoli TaxID=2736757 RepID=UPI00163DCF26|nr:cyclopropane-fatty-acyl-phospholipid synthase family protein [Nocardioides campestrisoli]
MSLLTTRQLSVAEAFESLVRGALPIRFTAYDGSAAGPPDAALGLRLTSERGLSYLLTAPGDLGLARAYAAGDLELEGVHPGDPYPALRELKQVRFHTPGPAEMMALLRSLGVAHLVPPRPPPQERLPRWRRTVEGLRHSRSRDARVIEHHYDVSNRFYELVLGPSMAYTCAVFPHERSTLEEAQAAKFDLVARKLDLQPGERMLDVGCGWGGLAMHAAREYGQQVLAVTLSPGQAEWARQAVAQAGLSDQVEVRCQDYREVTESGFDAVASIGMLEHVGVRNYAPYFEHLRERVRPGGRLLNHCITRPHNRRTETGAFIDRYIFPDGELTGVGRIIVAGQDSGLEMQHAENLRPHYARTLAAWGSNLREHWDACVAEAGLATAKVWGIYLAGSRLGFELNDIELHQVLFTRTEPDGSGGFGLETHW